MTKSRDASRFAVVGPLLYALSAAASLSGCGRETKPGADVDRTVDTTASALTASGSISAALAGKILEPTSGPIAAATTGNIEVGNDGSTSYRIPIWVPDGVNGMQPTLALEYDSGGRFGTLGPKWHVTGLSVIQRCPPTLAQDGIERPVSFTGDVFCLDGQRLVRQTGLANQMGDFRTERNPFQRISASAQDASGITTFQVYQPDGRIFYYGRTAGSRLSVSTLTEMNYAYYLDKIQDRFGNSILISYTSQRSQFTQLSGTDQSQELFPSAIQWGGTGDAPGQREVIFHYQDATTYNPLLHQRWIGGYEIVAGEHLDHLYIYGPDGLGNTPLLKQYALNYLTPSITGEQLLSQVQECDGAGICKQPTVISWEPGSTAYTRTDLTTTQGITDIPMPSAPTLIDNGNHQVSLKNVYRRIIPVDLNRDGRDDLVYRVWSTTCARWVARLATASGSYGAPINLPGAADADTGCPGGSNAGTSVLFPYAGDIAFADLDQNGYPDVISARGNNGTRRSGSTQFFPIAATMDHYYVYYNNSASPLGYDAAVSADSSGTTDTTNPGIAFGDVNGDGYPDILRPDVGNATGGGFYWYSKLFPTLKQIRGIGQGLADFALVDADGDGIAELFSLGAIDGFEYVNSPTANYRAAGGLPMTTRTKTMPQRITTARWTLDLNGDGTVDYVAVMNLLAPAQITAGLANTNPTSPGPTYALAYDTTLPAAFEIGEGWSDGLDDGVRVVDFNLDGRQDLVLMGNGANASGATRSNVVVLLSNGDGHFTTLTTSIPVGDPADGGRAAFLSSQPYQVSAERGYRTSASLDINGDGLPDFIQLEAGHVISYLRQGKMPDMVTQITEGTGRQMTISSAPLSDSTVYTVDASCGADSAHTRCLVSGQWVTKQITQTTLELPNLSQSMTQTYAYKDAEADRAGGRGFLGFLQEDVYGPGSQHVRRTFNHNVASLGAGYAYLSPLSPTTVRVDVDTPQGPNSHHYKTTTNTYGNVWYSGLNNGSLTVLPSSSQDQSWDCVSNGAGSCSGTTPRQLSWTDSSFAFDAYGNLTNRTVTHRDSSGGVIEVDTDTSTYDAADTNNWLVRLLNNRTSTSSAGPETVTRTTKVVTSAATQAVSSVEMEPTGDDSTHLLRRFYRDARGRIYTISDGAVFPSPSSCSPGCNTTCNASCQTTCAGAGANTGTCMQGCMGGCMGGCVTTCIATPTQVRSTYFAYEDADGVYVTTTTDTLGNSSRQWRHPGYGYLVEIDDPNHLAEVRSYDTFGRVLGETEASGRSLTVSYADAQNPGAVAVGGVNMTVTPGASPSGAINLHIDSLGRQVSKTMPVDATRAVTVWDQYDSVGRLGARALYTGTMATPLTNQQNAYVATYDDLNRAISDCHRGADGSPNQCKKNTYDGLQLTTTDETLRSIVRKVDPMGRLSTEQVSGVPNATFAYGAFSQLESETLSDGTGQTTIGYDVRGRRTSLTRQTAGLRKTSYNAFGEPIGAYKQTGSGIHVDTVSYGRDGLGRLTSITGSGMNRSLYWDKTYQGNSAINGIGKLVDAFDGLNREHFEYNANGLLYHEDWYVSLFGAPATSFDRVVYFYDPQGRVQYQYSPTNLPGQNYNGLNLTYGYDPYVGTVSSLSFSVGGTLWAASARNDLGQITTETMMSFGSNTSMTRTTGYYLPTGQVNTQTLTGSGGQQAQESYAYYSNGLPSQLAVSGVSGSWSETFNYDDLLRLTNWTPATGAPSVTYQYDSDGNLGQRQWSGETVNYAATPSARTSTVIQNGVTVSVDNYQIDLWGRIFDTPVTMVTYNANDEVTGIIEKTKGNQTDAVIRDGLGQRLATTYGASSYLVTLMNGMYEFKYNSSNGTYEERTRFAANGKLIGDQIKTANTARDTTTFYLTNNVGSVIAEASDTGVVTLRSRRDPYGNLLTNGTTPYLGADPTGSDPDGSSRLGYGGHERDPNSGLVDMNARFYSPRLGIFISPDSVIAHPFERRDYNPFAYVWDNPVAHNDPSGHDLGCGYLDWVLDNERGTVNSDGSIPVAPGVSMSTDANDHGITATSSTVDGMPAVDAVVSGADLMSPANAPEDSTVGVDATGAPQYQSRPDYETTVYGHPDPAPVNTAGQDAGNGGGGGHQYVGAVKIAKVLRTAGEVLSNLSPAGTKPGETEALGEVMSRADDVIAEGFEGVAQSIDNLTDRIDDLADRVNQVGSAISSAFSIDADPNFTSATGEPTYVPPRQ